VTTHLRANKLSRADRAPDGRVHASCDRNQRGMGGTPPLHCSSVWIRSAELSRTRVGPHAGPACREAAVSGANLPIEAVQWLLDPAPAAHLPSWRVTDRQVALTLGPAPGLLPLQQAWLAADGMAIRQPNASVERSEGFLLATGAATLDRSCPTFGKNQPLYNGCVCMHLCVLRRGFSSKRAVCEPPRTRTENRLIKSQSFGRFAPVRRRSRACAQSQTRSNDSLFESPPFTIVAR
jgi:hypothetical protein